MKEKKIASSSNEGKNKELLSAIIKGIVWGISSFMIGVFQFGLLLMFGFLTGTNFILKELFVSGSVLFIGIGLIGTSWVDYFLSSTYSIKKKSFQFGAFIFPLGLIIAMIIIFATTNMAASLEEFKVIFLSTVFLVLSTIFAIVFKIVLFHNEK